MGQRISSRRNSRTNAIIAPGSMSPTSVPADKGNDIEYRQDNQTTGDLNGQQIVGIYKFTTRIKAQMAFDQGDIMTITELLDENYAFATKDNNRRESGYIPLNYVIPVWYHGNISRKNAELILKSFRDTSGAYLLRDSVTGNSSSDTANMALSVKVEEGGIAKIKHCRIFRLDSLYINKSVKFSNALELVQYYTVNPLRLPGGISVYLANPCPQKFERYDLTDTTKDIWERSHKEFREIRKIGEGNFGDVFLGAYIGLRDEFPVAIKTMKRNKMGVEDFLKEATIMKNLKHAHIVPLFAVCTERDPYYIVLQYMNKGSLLDILRKHDPLLSCFMEKIDVLYQIASGMSYLENISVVHRDLAARNVLINDLRICKIADFGLARELDQTVIYNNPEGKFPIKWSALEVLTDRTYSTKSDVWSFGIVMMEVIQDGEMPYKGMSNQETMNRIQKGYRMPKPNECPQWLYENLILKTWTTNPIDRPTFHSLKDALANYDPQHTTDYTDVV